MRSLISVLGWLSVAGSVIGGLSYAAAAGLFVGLLYLILGLLVSAPFFGLAQALRQNEEQAEQIESIQEEVSQLRRKISERAPLAFVAPVSDGRAPLSSGPRKLAEEERPVVESPKIDLSSIKESDR
jgi:hypothetical protein